MCFICQRHTQAYSKKKPRFPNRSQTYDPPYTSLDTLIYTELQETCGSESNKRPYQFVYML